jgi:DNA mismatch endonuclease (patch repair protein)
MDTFTPAQRSRIMGLVRSKDTRPERVVRSLIHRMGYRFRLHRVDLPGKPDLVLPRLRAVIFVHGCFWHGHDCRRGGRLPKTHRPYWREKIDRNRQRDHRNRVALHRLGWRVMVIWECQLADLGRLTRRIGRFLD